MFARAASRVIDLHLDYRSLYSFKNSIIQSFHHSKIQSIIHSSTHPCVHAIFGSAATSSSSSHTEQDRRAMMKLMTPVFPIICVNCLVEIRSTREINARMLSIYLFSYPPLSCPFFSISLSLLAISPCPARSLSLWIPSSSTSTSSCSSSSWPLRASGVSGLGGLALGPYLGF